MNIQTKTVQLHKQYLKYNDNGQDPGTYVRLLDFA